jgi:hypothetical protein
MKDDGTPAPRFVLVVLFLLHLLPFATRPALIGGDEPHYALLAHSVATDLDLNLSDEYADVAAGSPAAGQRRAGDRLEPHSRSVGGAELFAHPIGLPLLTAPFLAVQQRMAPGSAPDLLLGMITEFVTFAALLAGWWLVERFCGSGREAALVVFGGYFSSPLWYYSRTFFTEPYIWSWCVLALAALAVRRFALAALLLALALAMKETALLLVLAILCGVLLRFGIRRAVVVAAGPAVFGVLFLVKNLMVAGTPFVPFQPFELGRPLEGAVGLLFDPAHGLLWFAPLLTFAGIGWVLRPGDPDARQLRVLSLLAFAAWFALTAAWARWDGGSCYGPRLLLPVLPALVVPLLQLRERFRGRAAQWGFALLFLAGFVVNWCAALDPFLAFWEAPAHTLVAKDALPAGAGLLAGGGLLYALGRFTESRTQKLKIEN